MPADNANTLTLPPPETTPGWISRRTAAWLTPVFLILGVECWLVVGKGNYGNQHQTLLILGAIACGLIPPIRDAFNWLWKAVEHPSPRTRLCVAVAIAILSSLFLYWTQRYEKTPFHLKFQDEFSYLIQMRMLARGRLWMPAIPLPDFFDTFYVFVTPVYASMYFPGAAMMYVPALLLHLPYYVAPLAASGACAALLYLVFSEILDGGSALLAVLILLSMGMFRMMSIMLMAQTPTLLLGLAMTYAVLQWRRAGKARWLIVLGVAAGWAAITRPADALCFAIVLAIVMMMDLRARRWRACGKTAAWVIVAALPFLLLQLTLNRNITGQWLTTPFARYTDLNYPGAFGFHEGQAPLHVSNVPEKQLFYELYAKGVIEEHQLKNLVGIELRGEWLAASQAAMPDPFFWLIVPMSILALWDRRLWAVWGMLPLYLVVLAGYSFAAVLPHYIVVVMPAMILLCVLPIRFLTGTFPRRAAMIRTMIGLGMIALTAAAMPQLNRLIHDQYFETPEIEVIDHTLARAVSPPAVVMFHFNRDTLIGGKTITNDPSIEPVFNSSVAWPDDAAIIRAHDLNPNVSIVGKPGDLDRPLYAYYAQIDPKRVFYLYDRGAPGAPPAWKSRGIGSRNPRGSIKSRLKMTTDTIALSRQQAIHSRNHLARLVLAAFVFTFVSARILVIFIMDGKLPPQLFFHVSGTHVHHLNYGIFLLSIIGAVLIFGRPTGFALSLTALIYGVGLALTFDEFGMWLHLGGPYWQRASYDAVVTIGSVLALIAYGSTIRTWRPKHFITLVVLIAMLCAFGYFLHKSMKWADQRIGPRLYQLEESGPS